MPSRYVALLRGINVGRAKRIAMADLRRLVEGLGFKEVKTLLNSGNVVFTAARAAPGEAAARIEKALVAALGVPSRVTVLTAKEVASAVGTNPHHEVADNPSRLLVAVLNSPADQAKLRPLLEQEWAPEALALGPRVAYLWCPDGIITSPLAEAVNRALRDAVTIRNWTTMVKLDALASDSR